jgi:hypothetical protein
VVFDESLRTLNLNSIIGMEELREEVRERQDLVVRFLYRKRHVEELGMLLIVALSRMDVILLAIDRGVSGLS